MAHELVGKTVKVRSLANPGQLFAEFEAKVLDISEGLIKLTDGKEIWWVSTTIVGYMKVS